MRERCHLHAIALVMPHPHSTPNDFVDHPMYGRACRFGPYLLRPTLVHHSKDWHKAVNHELSASLLKDWFQEFDSVVAQAVWGSHSSTITEIEVRSAAHKRRVMLRSFFFK